MTRATGGEPDRAVRERLVTEFDRSFVVEAGAGSGKTHSLAARMAAGIQRGAYEVDGMAAVTFTRKAAAELRGRFQQALEERLRAAAGEAERRRVEAGLAGIERLFAGTIHAFCAHLLRERPVDARVAPGFEELDDVEDLRLRRRAWRDFVAEARAGGMQAMLDLLEADVRPRDLDAAFAIVCEHEDVEFDRGRGDPPDPGPAWRDVDRFWRALTDLEPTAFRADTTCPVQQRFDEFDRRIAVANRRRPSSLAGLIKAWGKPTPVQKHWGANGKAVKALVDRFQVEVVEPFLGAWHAYVHRLAMAVLLAGREHYVTVRRRQNAVNYVDLLRIASRTLRECPHVRRALQAKYRWLFIDEFQDTDPIQAEIFLMLAADERRGANGSFDPFSLSLRPGALFVVGDPKQSIFRFRRADIDTYNRVAARIEATGGERLGLVANFRSVPGVCEFPNTVFPPRFGDSPSPWSPAYAPLAPIRSDSDAAVAEPCIVRLTVAADKADEATREEAASIAAYIRGEVAAGRRAHGDFLVLTRFRPRLSEYTRAFDALEIPVEVSGAGFFCRSPEVQALAQLLAALADPLDSVSLVGVLRGPLFGVSDPELFRFRQAGGRFELTAPLPNSDESTPALEPDAERAVLPASVLTAMRRLKAMLRLTWELPLGAAVDHILEDTGWLALATTRPAGAAAGHLLQAVDRVRQVVEDGGGLADAADALDEEESSNDAEALPLEPGRLDVVRLMNLHKAKGLEARVVVLADAARDFEFPLTVRVVRTGAQPTGYLRVVTRREGRSGGLTIVGQPGDWAAHEAAEHPYVEAERLRLLYVASTRAEDRLVICRAPAVKGAKKVWRDFEAFLANVPELSVSPPVAAAEADPAPAERDLSLVEQERSAAAAALEAVHARLREASWAAARVTGPRAPRADPGGPGERAPDLSKRGPGLGGTGAAPGATGAEADLDGTGVSPVRDAAIGGALFGSLVHGLLEHAVRHALGRPDADPSGVRADLDRLARWLTVETPELRPFIPAALDLVEDLRGAPFWSELREAARVDVEVPFAVRLAPGETLGTGEPAGLPTIVRGVIDVVYEIPAAAGQTRWGILDYKTDRTAGSPGAPDDARGDAALVGRHRGQLVRYKAAWERATGAPVTREGVVAVRTRRTIWMDGSPEGTP